MGIHIFMGLSTNSHESIWIAMKPIITNTYELAYISPMRVSVVAKSTGHIPPLPLSYSPCTL